MENLTSQPIKMTLRLPADLAQKMDEERMRLADELQTRLSANQFLERTLRRGLERP